MNTKLTGRTELFWRAIVVMAALYFCLLPSAGLAQKTNIENQCPDGQFLDIGADVCRPLVKKFGFDQALFDRNVGSKKFTLRSCTSNALVELLEDIGPAGGVINIPACKLVVNRKIFLPSNVIFQGAAVGKTLFQAASGFDETMIQVKRGSNVIVRDLTLDGARSAHLLLSAWYADNVLFERVEARNAGGSGIHFRYAKRITIRYSESHAHRQWHGIGSKDCFPARATEPDVEECDKQVGAAGTVRPGVAWSTDYAIYSNKLHGSGEYGIDTHASNGEIAGNRIYGNRYAAKFPDASRLWVHHNELSGSQRWGIFIYSTLDIAERAPHDIAIYANTIGSNGLLQLRVAAPATDVYLLHNDYQALANVYRISGAQVYRCRGSEDSAIFTYGRRPSFATTSQCRLGAVGKLFSE